jgi:mRNA-degrading endonuclease RelE of RelBE toxin-antitoxin system
MSYTIRLSKPVEKYLERLDKSTLKRLQKRLGELAAKPQEMRISKFLVTSVEERSARVGKWRIIYRILETEKIIEVLSVSPRDKAYEK